MNRLVIFDLDGTLSNSHQAIIHCFQQAARSVGAPIPPEEAIAALIGLPLTTMFEALHPDHPIDVLVERYKSTYIAFDKQHTRLFPGIHEMLKGLDGKVAIATSKGLAGALRTVRMFGIESLFDEVLGFDCVARPKPAPDMIVEVLKRTGTLAESAVMVGDTTYDLEMADAAGVRGIAVTWGAHSAKTLERWEQVHTVQALWDVLKAAE